MTKGSIPNSLDEREQQLTELFKKGQFGDAAAYREFLERSIEMLTNYFRRSLGRAGSSENPQVADLVQETLLAIHEKRGTFDPSQKVGPWMFAVARYKMIDFFRTNGRESVSKNWDILEATLVSESESEAFNNHKDLESLLDGLPEKQKQMIRMLKLEGRSVRDVAKKIGMSESAIKVALHRAMKTLKLRLREGTE
jgi:RNA polymerase sigma-70 factor, ECF subfamily